MVKESARKRQSTSCNLCRTIKRKCDGGFPCSNCTKRNHICTYPNIDHRKHRYSSEYITQLEMVNRQTQECLSELIRIKDDPQELARRIRNLSQGQYGVNSNNNNNNNNINASMEEYNHSRPRQNSVSVSPYSNGSTPQVQTPQVQASQSYPQLTKIQQGYAPQYQQQFQQTNQFSNATVVASEVPPPRPGAVVGPTQIPAGTPIEAQTATMQQPYHQWPPTLPSARSNSTPNNIHLPPIPLNPSHPNLPPPPVIIPGASIPGRRTNHSLDLTSKYFRGPDGRNGYFMGATSVYDESMLVNSSSRPSIPKLDSVKQEGDNSDECTNGNENSETLIGEVKVDLQVLTSQKVSDLINIALTYFDHQILCYILNTRKTQELFEDLRAHVDEIGYAEQIFCTYPNNTYISPELIYSLSVIGSIYQDDLPGAVFYYELSQRIIFHNYILSKSSYPKLVALVLNAFFELNRGELSSAWQLSGMSFRMGFDLGLHDSTKEEPDEAMNNLKNLTYWGTFIIDNYAGYIFGRPKMLMYDCDYPIFNNGLNDIKLPHIVGLLAMGDPMITSIYQIMPFKDAEEFKRTFIVKYNQLREYNNRLIQWRNALPKELVWNISSLKRSARITDHSFKFAFYLMFIILNKPFLLLPIGSDISIFTVICQEMEIIFRNVEDPCYLKNIVVLYVMILVCKLMLIQLLNRNSKKIDEQFERLEFFISYIKAVFKADVWILAKYPLAMLESRVMVLKKELKQHEQVNNQSTPAITSTPSDANAVQVKITGTSISSSSSSGRSNSIVDPMIPYTDENMSQNVGFLKMVDALFSQGTITPTQGMFPLLTAGTPTAAQEQIDNSLHISNNGATGAIVQGSSETFNNIFSFDLLDLDAYMQQ